MLQSKFSTIFIALIYSLTFLKLSLSTDTLSPNQSINGGQTLISKNQIFVLGFFSPGSSTNKFLGIWYKSTPDVVVWVANRKNPVKGSNGALSVTINGTLFILSGNKTVIWSSDLSTVAFSPVLPLLDNGNLILIDNMNETSHTSYLWQSFDYPSDTRLPGMLLVDDVVDGKDKYLMSWKSSDDPSVGEYSERVEYRDGLVQMVLYEGKVRQGRSGPYYGENFNNVPFSPTLPFRPLVLFGKDKVSVYDNGSSLTRLTMESSGYINRYTMNETRNGWNLVNTYPRDTCDKHGRCGPNGICRISKVPICECLKGFVPRSQRAWDFQDYSDGCVRTRPLDCRGGDGFFMLSATFPDALKIRLNANISRDECRVQCYENCSCMAYATPFVTSGCLMWFGDLIDVREPLGVESNLNINIRLPLSDLDVESNNDPKKTKNSPSKLIFILIVVGVLISIVILLVVLRKIRKTRQGEERKIEDQELPSVNFETVAVATSNFSSENMIGEGGYGPVYLGSLSDGQQIAVKRLSKTSTQGLEEFENEVSLIAKLQHRNLVRLLGCCSKGEERMLIYEYMQNKSLNTFIFDKDKKTILPWPKRCDIIMGIVKGLLYLHHDSRLHVIHRDLKTSNILLDENLNPKISDFGLARIVGGNQGIARTRRVIGTHGYMAPEYTINDEFSIKSDVFSMGVVLLEILSGKRNNGFRHKDHYHSLLGHAWLLWKEGRAIELMDKCLKDTYIEYQVKRCIHVGLLCVQKRSEDRPNMSSVVFMLGSEEIGHLPNPKEPGFFMGMSYSNEETCKEELVTSTISVTDIEAR